MDRSDDIKGVDADGNGVRDDIDRRIAAYPLTTEQKALLIKFAGAVEATHRTTQDDNSIAATVNELQKGIVCSAAAIPDYRSYVFELRAISLNTEARTKSYLQFQDKASGRRYSLVEESDC
ncbi:hypothetical protein K788_00009645 (plasmid) [Paraburkholderia caribensis MBA4]|uniref:Uncharacterized protein n=1 Tax=Paraburkholderia caribensis MBA4 TaxID=1323664 RepID=A0A0P0RQX1_9BURK|nr:hypothetical protein K788_00009645 [Paraburkholderia caribensis MBA4]